MKIQLSKSQWEEIGKTAGWIQSQFYWLLSPEKTKALTYIWKHMPGNLNKTDRVQTYSSELAFNDLPGDAYIAISFDGDENAMRIEKYYESEFVNDSMGETKKIAVNWENPQETVHMINTLVDRYIK